MMVAWSRSYPSPACEMATILVADDDAHIRDVVQYALERDGHKIVTAADGARALLLVEQGGIDLVVLDILMPEMDGLEVCRKCRSLGNLPIIFLSSRGEEIDRVVGLELGGDDYLAKPFSPRELASRVKALLRRVQPACPPPNKGSSNLIVHGRLELDLDAHTLRADGATVDLTVTEFRILHALLERPGHVLARGQIIDRLRDAEYHITERTIDTHIRRIRAKLRSFGIDPIETVHGLGYKAAE
jgi:two-component system OmpR family response regulator